MGKAVGSNLGPDWNGQRCAANEYLSRNGKAPVA